MEGQGNKTRRGVGRQFATHKKSTAAACLRLVDLTSHIIPPLLLCMCSKHKDKDKDKDKVKDKEREKEKEKGKARAKNEDKAAAAVGAPRDTEMRDAGRD